MLSLALILLQGKKKVYFAKSSGRKYANPAAFLIVLGMLRLESPR